MNEFNAALEDLIKRAKGLPPMTERQREVQRFDFAYGNLACTTNHKPTRQAFALLAKSRGWTAPQFTEWAEDKAWWQR
jgi:hypothetical protein